MTKKEIRQKIEKRRKQEEESLWWSETGSWFRRQGAAYLKEGSVIDEDDVGGWVRVTRDEE